MIVTCEQCATQFHLDDSKVPEDGIRVRCSRCKHVFLVESPNRSDLDRAADLALDAFRAAPHDDVESDWQFNAEVQPAESDLADLDGRVAAEAAVDDLLGASFGDSLGDLSEDFDLDGSDPGPQLDAQSAPAFEPELETADAEPAMDAGGAEDLAPPGELADEERFSEFGTSDDLDAFAAAGEPAVIDATPDRASGPAPAAEAAAPFEDSAPAPGQPGEGDPGAPEAPSPVRAAGVAVEHVPSGAAAESAQVPFANAPAQCGIDTAALEADLDGPSENPRIARVRTGLAWGVVFALCAFAGLAGLVPIAPAVPSNGSRGSIDGLEVHAIRGRWIENSAAGPIYVVRGDLRVGAAGSPETDQRLRVRLVDAAGRPIAAESAALGPPLPLERLREWRLRDLRDEQEKGARRLARTPLSHGERRPFVAVLGDIPPTAKGYEITRVE